MQTGGYEYKVPGGRPDGTVSRASMANSDLPPHKQRNVELLAQYFYRKGLSMDDVVVLSGAHTLGVTRCGTFDYRLMSDQDKGMNATFRNELRRQCGYDANRVVSLDAGSPYGFDTSYYATCWPTAPCSSPTPRSTRPRTVARSGSSGPPPRPPSSAASRLPWGEWAPSAAATRERSALTAGGSGRDRRACAAAWPLNCFVIVDRFDD